MKSNRVFEVTFKNIKRGKGVFARNCALLAALMLVVSVVSYYLFGVGGALKKAEAENLSEKQISAVVDDAFFQNVGLQNKIKALDNVDSISIYASEMFFMEQEMKLEVNGEEKPIATSFEMVLQDDFPDNFKTEFAAKTDEKMIKYGELYGEEGVVCTENFLLACGYTESEMAGLVGSKIVLIGNVFDPELKRTVEKTLINSILTGVVNDKLSELSIYDENYLPTIYQPLVKKVSSMNKFIFCEIYFDSYAGLEKLVEDVRGLLPSEYSLSNKGDRTVYAALEAQRKTVNAIMFSVGALLLAAVLLNGIYSIYKAATNKNGTYSVYLSEGMPKSALWLSVLTESLFALAAAVVLAFAITIPVSLGLNALIASAGALAMALDFGIIGISIGIAAATGAVAAVSVSFVPLILFNKKTV